MEGKDHESEMAVADLGASYVGAGNRPGGADPDFCRDVSGAEIGEDYARWHDCPRCLQREGDALDSRVFAKPESSWRTHDLDHPGGCAGGDLIRVAGAQREQVIEPAVRVGNSGDGADGCGRAHRGSAYAVL